MLMVEDKKEDVAVAQKRGEEYVEEDMKVLGLWAEDAQEKLN
jgi:hypothetical protein